MGFRSTFVSEDSLHITAPSWFVAKYQDAVNFGPEGLLLPLSSKREYKAGGAILGNFESDLSQVLREIESPHAIRLVWLHENGGVTRSNIRATSIKHFEPDAPFVEVGENEWGEDSIIDPTKT